MFRSAAVVTALALCACKGNPKPAPSEPDPAAAPTGSATPTPTPTTAPTPAAAPFTGPLTPDRVLSARGLLDGALPPWDVALARVEQYLGKATKVEGRRWWWAAVEGDRCAYTYLERQDGKPMGVDTDLGSMMTPMAVAKDGPIGNRRECLAVLGITPGPAEDPAAPGPPTDGTPVTAQAFRTGAVVARSRWVGQTVGVVGVVATASVTTGNADRFTTVGVKDSATDAERPVSCNLPRNAKAPALATGAAVIATGKVRIAEWTSVGSGDVTVEAMLDDCALIASPKRR